MNSNLHLYFSPQQLAGSYEAGSDGNLYLYHATAKNYSDAKMTCEADGASLLIINSSETQRFLNSHYGNEFLWLSLTGGGNQWRWTHADGSEEHLSDGISNSNWAIGEPNEAGDNCVRNGQSGWADVSCASDFKFL